MLNTTELIGFGVSSGGNAVQSYITSYVSTINNNAGYSFASSNIGTATSDRLVVVCANSNGTAGNITSATLDGVTMTPITAASGAGRMSAIFSLRVTTGTTATIAFVITGGIGVINGGISIYTITNQESDLVVNSNNNIGTSSSISTTISYNPSDIIIGTSTCDNNSSGSWTNLTIDYNGNIESGQNTYISGSKKTTTAAVNETITASFSVAANNSICVASWR